MAEAAEGQWVHEEEAFEEAHLSSNGRATHARPCRLSPCRNAFRVKQAEKGGPIRIVGETL